MIEYATREDLLRLSSSMPLTEQASVRKAAEQRNPTGATFLSHSSKDQELVVGAAALLAEHGATVYIDKKDPKLPPYTSTLTASGLKKRIRESRNFVLLASENSKNSRWVPWELGIADQAKNLLRVAILPTVERQQDKEWTKWEYLGLYRRIVWGDIMGYDEPLWMVLNETTRKAMPLSRWLSI